MITREAGIKLQRLAKQYPVIMLSGPRQSGKTTLCRKIFPEKKYVLFEDPDTRAFALADPRRFLAQFPDGAIFDEVQKAPELISYLQGIVDAQKRKGMFILTGSENLLLSEKIPQSLAGRTAVLKLLPFSYAEIAPALAKKNLDEILFTGFYPRIYDEHLDPHEAMGFYFQTYIERDVREIVNVKDLLRFQQFMKLCAGRIGQLLNLVSLSNEAGISHQTARDWLSILEVSFIVFRLPPYYRNFNKRVTKSPKLFFYDVGFAAYLLGISNSGQMSRDPLRGNLFENMVVCEILKGQLNRAREGDLSFFRDSNGNEVDLLMPTRTGLGALEIKSGQTIVPDFFKGLNYFTKIAGEHLAKKYIVYGGDENQERSQGTVLSFRTGHTITDF
ncbi:MAG: ATP-binding protein [Candidatus Omnitrophica bacterium]|nr:ATP-binding protein [Candidatus Omnitrophota bacterium]